MQTLSTTIGALLRPDHVRGRLLAGSAWGLVDQALISGMNFGTTVLLARAMGPADFGTFSVAYLLLLLANSLQTSLVTQPHNVLGAPLEGQAYRDYTSSSALGQLAVAGVLALLPLAAAALAPLIRMLGDAPVLIALGAAILAWQLQEFARRVMYTKTRIRAAFVNDVASYGGQLVVLLVLLEAGRLSPSTALYAIAGTSAMAAGLGWWEIRDEIRGRIDFSALRDSWRIGKWLSAATLTSWLASQMYPVLTAGLIGVSATGLLRAVQNLIAPTQILANAYQMVVTPQAALQEMRGGGRAVARFLARSSVVLFVPIVIYFLIIGGFARSLLTLFYSSAYVSAAIVIWPLGLAYLLSYVGRVLGLGLAAMQDTRPVFHAQVAAAATTFTVGLLLIRRDGLVGAAVGAAITQAVLVAALAWYFQRRRRQTVVAPHPDAVQPAGPPAVGA